MRSASRRSRCSRPARLIQIGSALERTARGLEPAAPGELPGEALHEWAARIEAILGTEPGADEPIPDELPRRAGPGGFQRRRGEISGTREGVQRPAIRCPAPGPDDTERRGEIGVR